MAINDILHSIPRDIGNLLYVDDLVIFTAASNIKHIQRKLQIAINKIQDWCVGNGYNLSNDKTTAVHFHRMRGIEYKRILLLNNKNITFKSVVKVLGLYLDQRRRCKEHIECVRQKTIEIRFIKMFIKF